MRFVAFYLPGEGPRLGLVSEEDLVYDLTSANGWTAYMDLVKAATERGVTVTRLVDEEWQGGGGGVFRYSDLDVAPRADRPHLLKPVDAPEVWGFGVTYYRSREAREYETTAKGIYDRVYDAERPEVFFKGTPARCVGPNEPVAIRFDSNWSVPEPELSFVVGYQGDIVGYTIGNDMSARDIEGDNPLYLPQAKIYTRSSAIGPAVVPPEALDPRNLQMKCRILKEGEVLFEGEVSTNRLKRSPEELLHYLLRCNIIPPGTVAMTGTGIVPPDDFTLKGGEVVEIWVEKIGTLRNPVIRLEK
jgi:2-dehydro-3-deoxy-D-arabinonate dehydratase